MSYIAQIDWFWYEGGDELLRIMQQRPVVVSVSIPRIPEVTDLLFWEHAFDVGSRTRRGRLYELTQKSWFPGQIEPSPTGDYPTKAYKAARVSVEPGWEVILGDSGAQSYWQVVLSEKTSDAHYLTLKSKTYFGVLPEVNRDAIPEANRQDILQALDAVVEAAPIQAPQPVIDACRNAACHMITARFLESNSGGKKDLGELVKWLLEEGRLKSCAEAANAIPALMEASASHLINRLHSRAKPNVAAQHGTRPVSQQDANLAVDAIAFLLQDFGWAEVT